MFDMHIYEQNRECVESILMRTSGASNYANQNSRGPLMFLSDSLATVYLRCQQTNLFQKVVRSSLDIDHHFYVKTTYGMSSACSLSNFT